MADCHPDGSSRGLVKAPAGGGEVALGAGATFRLIFPEAIGSVEEVEGRPEAPRPIGRLRLLVVDDDPLVLRAVCRALETDGHVVSPIKGGREAIETFRESLGNGQPFAAVITDLGMPHMDGRRVDKVLVTTLPKPQTAATK